jgi:hypothetical protein
MMQIRGKKEVIDASLEGVEKIAAFYGTSSSDTERADLQACFS